MRWAVEQMLIPVITALISKAGALMNAAPVDCQEPHTDEVFAILTHPASEDEPFPNDLAEWAPEPMPGP